MLSRKEGHDEWCMSAMAVGGGSGSVGHHICHHCPEHNTGEQRNIFINFTVVFRKKKNRQLIKFHSLHKIYLFI